MGLFGSEKNKELLRKLYLQIEQQKGLILKLSQENDELQKAMVDNERIEALLDENNALKSEVEELKKNKDKKIVSNKLQAIQIKERGQMNLITTGMYKAGEDFPSGKYDFCVIDGKGTLSCSRGDVSEQMSKEICKWHIQEYRNLYAPNGCKIEIDGNLKLLMFSLKPVKPKWRDENCDNCIVAGRYKIGEDIPEGRWILEVKSGEGSVYEEKDEMFLELGKETGIMRARIFLKKGRSLFVDGNLKAEIFEAKPLSIIEEKHDMQELNLLCVGVYEAGIDIPYGYYNIELISGKGTVELKKNDENASGFYEDFSQKEMRQYKNLLIEIGDKIILDGNLIVSLNLMRPYISKDISNNVLKEIEDVKNELSILNNNIIEKYYSFSDYLELSSQECKNKLCLLKQREKEMRTREEDVVICDEAQNKKLLINSTRKILRSFNSECANVMMNISAKNVDACRRKIQQSYESLNKLYIQDGIQISEKLLEVKLEQITLLYTYELKYEQEKDIQRAIKEQMREEAKAQKEIEQQKRKIEKDLQQHVGEVNRLMKYLQKSQIDVEKQLYIDKINELQQKIKLLESDKAVVVEREANAKAGFVYIISNIGSFGEGVFKIGMTRRLEPMDRIYELSSASVPFEFDVHAMIFSSDAPALETALHKHFADKAVNKVNPRKEFFRVSIDEIEEVVKREYNESVKFTKIPMATEYRQSINI